MKVTLLGCGTSGGVPRPGLGWGACDPENPKNRRRRVSVHVEEEGTSILFDTSPDLREQLLDADINHLDAVFYTHDHADHTHGIDDLRSIFYAMGRRRVPVYADSDTLAVLKARFGYVFDNVNGYPPIATAHTLPKETTVNKLKVKAFPQIHGPITSWGFRVGKMAYSTDLNDLTEEAWEALKGLDLWIVDALRYDPHPTHPHLDLTLSWIERLRPKRAILTHMAADMDYETLKAELPAGVEPGYDGMVVEL